MSNIEKHTGENIGGMISPYWCFASDVASETINKAELSVSITLRTGAYWHSLYATPDTVELEEEESEKPAGVQYSYRLKCLVPQDRQAVTKVLRQMAGRGLIIWTKDKNGMIRILGTRENPMVRTGKLKKPASVEGFNGWELQFAGDFSLPAFYGSELDSSAISTE